MSGLPNGLPPTERSALKEWAVMVDALGCGDIIGIVRKGGIRDQRSGFSVRQDRFFLYPTRFHASAEQLSERFRPRLARSHAAMAPAGMVRIEYVAQPAMIFTVTDPRRLERAQYECALSPSALLARFTYRQPGVEFVTLRVERLLNPVVVPELKRYSGCVSWLELEDEIKCAPADVAPVMGEYEFQDRLHALVPLLTEDARSSISV
jgi:hypothetical protein